MATGILQIEERAAAGGAGDGLGSARAQARAPVPVNVLLVSGGPTVPELARAGVAHVSVGGALQLVALAAVARAGRVAERRKLRAATPLFVRATP